MHSVWWGGDGGNVRKIFQLTGTNTVASAELPVIMGTSRGPFAGCRVRAQSRPSRGFYRLFTTSCLRLLEVDMRWTSKATAVILLLLVAASANAGSLTISFDYSRDTSSFFGSGTANGIAARATLEKAASGDLAGIFMDDLASHYSPGRQHLDCESSSVPQPMNPADTEVRTYPCGRGYAYRFLWARVSSDNCPN